MCQSPSGGGRGRGVKDKQGLKGSFGVMVKDREDSVSREQLCKVSIR